MKEPKIALVQLNLTVGDIKGNFEKIKEAYLVYADSEDAPDMVVTSEMSITGYPLLDLVEYPGLMESHNEALWDLARLTSGRKTTLIVGGIRLNYDEGKRFFNSLFVLDGGRIAFSYDKKLLPTYNIFDEARHYEPGKGINIWRKDGVTYAFFICEDIWDVNHDQYTLNPFQDFPTQVVDVIVTINASPSNVGKLESRFKVAGQMARMYRRPVVYVNQVGANDSLVFDGHSFVLDHDGAIVMQMRGFSEDNGLVQINQTENDIVPRYVEAITNGIDQTNLNSWTLDDSHVLYLHAVRGIRDYCDKCGFKKVVVGSSGGVDSALVLALATDALGAENVTAITMPSGYSSEGSWKDSEILCDNLGIELKKLPIGTIYDDFFRSFESATGTEGVFDVANENTQARIRGSLLMAYSNRFGALLLTTGNKSEVSVGYCTLYGDMNGGLNPIGDMYKTEVFTLCRWYNSFHGREIIPNAIIDKAPSAELRPDQKDEDSLPAYPILDAMLRLLLEHAVDADIYNRWIAEFKALVTEREEQEQLIRRIVGLLENAEFKRRQAAPIIRCQRVAFGFGRNVPIAQRFTRTNTEAIVARILD